jgi:hypothetical protein
MMMALPGGTFQMGSPETDDMASADEIILIYPQGRFGPNQRKPLTEVCSYDHWGTEPPWR